MRTSKEAFCFFHYWKSDNIVTQNNFDCFKHQITKWVYYSKDVCTKGILQLSVLSTIALRSCNIFFLLTD